jgi:site-specific DNA recombinase
MDSLDITDRFYEKKYQDMETRLYRLYDEIEGVESSISEVKNRLLNIKQKKISEENIYQFLLYFDKLYDKFTDLEKKEFLNSFVEQVDIYEQEQPDGRFLKHIKFRFPVYFNNRETTDISWDNENTVETVVLLSHKKPDGHINVKVEFGEGEGKLPLDNIAKRAEEYKPKERVTYKMIKEYIEAKYGFKVHTAYIAEVKRDLGLPMYDAPNAVEELKQPRKHPTPEKVEAIKDALKHFEII